MGSSSDLIITGNDSSRKNPDYRNSYKDEERIFENTVGHGLPPIAAVA